MPTAARRLPLGILLLCLAATLATPFAHAEKIRKPLPALPAAQYPLHDTHPLEHVTIAAEPCDTKDILPHTRLNYFDHDMLPIRVIVTNDSELAITLDDARIVLIDTDNNTLQAATPEELQRRLFTVKSATGTRLPLGLPIPITVGKKDINKDITLDDRDFGFQTTTIAPHTTVAGYLYYDIQRPDASPNDPPFLTHTTLELRKVRLASTNKSLDTFEISLQPTNASKPSTK
jgi:hypothetical protein